MVSAHEQHAERLEGGGAGGPVELVIDPAGVGLVVDGMHETGSAQLRQMVGDVVGPLVERGGDLAHAAGTGREQLEDPGSGPVGHECRDLNRRGDVGPSQIEPAAGLGGRLHRGPIRDRNLRRA